MARIRYKEALGIEVKKGKPAIGEKPKIKDLHKLYINESMSIREIAEALKCSKDMVYRSLKEYNFKRRPDNKRSKLRKIEKSVLKDKIKEKGITQAAREFRVDIRTFKKYIGR